MAKDSDNHFWEDLGREVCAPLYFSLCHWINERARREGIRQLLFLARDGHILKQCWDLLNAGGDGTPATYLWVSRRAACIAAYELLGEADRAFLFRDKGLSGHQRLLQLGWPLEPLAAQGLTPQQLVPDHPAVAAFIRDNAAREREVFLDYLGSLGLLDAAPRKVGLVDLGWHASLQAALEKLLAHAGSGAVLHGYYFGTLEPLRLGETPRAEGLFINRSLPKENHRTVRYCRGLVELLFTAPHPSVKRVQRAPGGFVPEFAGPHENASNLAGLMAMQQAALAEISVNAAAWAAAATQVQQLAFARLTRLLRQPSRTEARRLGPLGYFGGLGEAPRLQCFARPEAAPWQFGRLRRQYKAAPWRSGFLASLAPWQQVVLRPLVAGMTPDRS